MKAKLLTPGRAAIIAIPMIGFFSTPFWPFAKDATLWFGIPAVLVWAAILVILTVVSIQVVEVLYQHHGGREADRLERERLETQAIQQLRAERLMAEDEEGIR
jgi:fatty acid desaturase